MKTRNMMVWVIGLLMLMGAVSGLIIQENTGVSLPSILIDDTDFTTQETSVGGGSVTVKYKHAADSSWSTKDVSSSGWDEIGDGVYEIDFTAAEIGSEADTNQGIFLYMVEGSGYLTYYGSTQMITQSLKDNADDINLILADTSGQDTASEIRTLMTGGNWALPTQNNLTSGIVVLTPATEAQIDHAVNGSLVDNIWDEAISGHISAGSIGRLLKDILDAIFSWGGGGGGW